MPSVVSWFRALLRRRNVIILFSDYEVNTDFGSNMKFNGREVLSRWFEP